MYRYDIRITRASIKDLLMRRTHPGCVCFQTCAQRAGGTTFDGVHLLWGKAFAIDLHKHIVHIIV